MAETLTLTLIPQFPLLPAFLASFCLIYLLGYFAVFRRWSHTHRPDATSCFISLFHGTPAVFLAAAALLNAPFSFAAVNTPFQNLVLDFSIAYFTVDLLHYLVLLPADYHLFIAHHLATLFVFLTCRYVALHGAASLLVLLVIAELTSLFQNVWTLAGLRRYDVPLAEKVYNVLALPFYSLYSLMRVVMGPVFFCKMSVYYLSGEAVDVIPMSVSVSWIVVVGGAIAVSNLWIWNRWVEFFVERNQTGGKKQR